MPKLDTPTSVQAASNAIMQLRGYADETEVAALEALTAVRAAKADLMENPAVTMMAAELSDVESLLYEIAAVGAKARQMHMAGAEFLRRHNIALPNNPPGYGEELPESVAVKIKVPQRR